MHFRRFAWVLLLALLFAPRSDCQHMETNRATEPAAFWNGLANDEKAANWRRGMAVYFLFDRQVRPGLSVKDLAAILNKPTWLYEKNVSVVSKVAGFIPLEPAPGDTVIRIRAFSSDDAEAHNRESIGIYLSVAGRVNAKDFFSVVKGVNQGRDADRRIRAWAFSRPWDDYVRTVLKKQ